MDRYRKVEKLRPKSPIPDNEIRITSKGFVRNYVYFATALLQERRGKDIVLKAMGQAITKTVTIAELIKKKFPGLHQDTAISSVSITDVWEPIDEEGLDTYQAPSHVEQGKQYNNNHLSQLPSKQSHEGYSDHNEGADEEEGSGETNVDASCCRGGGRSWDDSSDDCVILEEDPDKPVKVLNERVDNDSDDLLVISEKGQVACRDYPHPRHLCAKFPFATTLHEFHCDKCHCYVCDTIAPCVYWGKENSLAHCNATDKIAFWTLQREKRKATLANIFTHSVPLLWPLEY